MEENNYKKHFNKELEILRKDGDKDLIIDKFEKVINDIIDISSKQGHSGTSAHFYANYLSTAIKNVLLFNPLSPITGDESEWVDVNEDSFQNNRIYSIFKDKKTGKCHYLDAIVWKGEKDGDTFTGKVEEVNSSLNIKFPFIPKTFYIDVVKVYGDKDDDCIVDGDGKYYTYKIKDEKQLDEVAEYYTEWESGQINGNIYENPELLEGRK